MRSALANRFPLRCAVHRNRHWNRPSGESRRRPPFGIGCRVCQCRDAPELKVVVQQAIAQLALQFSIANEDLATCIVGSANPENIRKWVQWSELPLDNELLGEVLAILAPIHDWFYIEGRPENNDPPSASNSGDPS